MNESTTVVPAPTYVELASTQPKLDPGTAGALLRDYLAILAYHFERPGADRSTQAILTAFDNLPGLLVQDAVTTRQAVTVTAENAADGLAEILAEQLTSAADSACFLRLARALVGQLWRSGSDAPSSVAFEATMVILRHLDGSIPTLGPVTVSLTLERDDTALAHPAWKSVPAGNPAWQLSVACSRSLATVVDSELGSSQGFVSSVRSSGAIASLSPDMGYLEILIH